VRSDNAASGTTGTVVVAGARAPHAAAPPPEGYGDWRRTWRA
jgi:hypothetical protein